MVLSDKFPSFGSTGSSFPASGLGIDKVGLEFELGTSTVRFGSCYGPDFLPVTVRVNRRSTQRVDSVNPVGQHQFYPVNPVNSFGECCRIHASESRLGSDITKSYLASFAQGDSCEFITPPFYGFTFL
ncbi:hypothetical protein Hanom_Chr04g00326271 [Helianthus anomalus]